MVIKTGNLALFLCVLVVTQLLCAEQPEVVLQVLTTQGYSLKSVMVNQPFVVRVILKNVKNPPSNLVIPGIADATVMQRYQEQKQYSINNQTTQAFIYTYILARRKPGQIVFGPVVYDTDHDQIASNSIVLTVNDTQKIDSASTPDKQELSCSLLVEQNQAVVGEKISFVIKLFVPDSSITDIALKKIKQNGLRVARLEGPTATQLADQQFELEWRGVFFPEHAGDLPARAKIIVYKETAQNSFFGFWMPRKEQQVIASNKVIVSTQSVPKHEKIDAVGVFSQMQLTTNTERVAVGEALVTTITITGNGDADSLKAPGLKPLEGLTYYESKKTLELCDAEFTKSFDYIVQAREAGEYTLVPEDFVYFDASARAVKKITGNSLTIIVEPAEPASVQQPDKDPKIELRDNAQDQIPNFVIPWWLFTLLLVMPLASIPGKLSYDSFEKTRARRKNFNQARKQLEHAYSQQDPYAVYCLLKITLVRYISDTIRDLTDVNIEKKILARYDSTAVESWRQFVASLFACVFCAHQEKGEKLPDQLFEQAKFWIKRLEKL